MHRESWFLGFVTGCGFVVDIAPSPCNLAFNVTHNFFQSNGMRTVVGKLFLLVLKYKKLWCIL